MQLLEHYTSVQGEGPRTGLPIQFIRFAGCNMRCPGWPCDTQHAIWPKEYRGNTTPISVEGLMLEVQKYPRRVCLTGGEPFVQNGLPDLINKLIAYDFEVDVFTNGSFVIPSELIAQPELGIIMDWKLQGSGEASTRLAERQVNVRRLLPKDSIKFVVKDRADFEEAIEIWNWFKQTSVVAEIWAGVAWGHLEEQTLVEWVLEEKLPWRLNVQVHKFVWDAERKLV